MDKAKEILEQALSYKNCDGLIEENSRLEDAVLYAINEALRQPPVSGSLPLRWSPVESEREWQEAQFKRMFPNYPNEQPDWQRLNFFIYAGLEYLKLQRQ